MWLIFTSMAPEYLVHLIYSVCVCMHVCMYMCTHMNMEANEQLWVSFLTSYLPCWVRHPLSQVWSVPIHLGWLLSGFQEPTCLSLPDTRVINVYHNTHVDPRGRIQFFMLVQQALYQLISVFNLICSPLHSLEMKHVFIGGDGTAVGRRKL